MRHHPAHQPDGERWAIEVKRSLTPTLSRGFHQARADLNPHHSFVVVPREGRFPLAPVVDAAGLAELATEVAGWDWLMMRCSSRSTFTRQSRKATTQPPAAAVSGADRGPTPLARITR